MNMGQLEDFLSGIPSSMTRKSYKHGIRKFEEYLGKPIENLKIEQNVGRTVEKFFVWLKDNGYSQNSRRNLCNGAIQYLKFLDISFKYRKSLGIYRTELSVRDHLLTINEVQKMAEVSNLKESIILEVFLLGLRVSDACHLEWKLFDIIGQTAPIPIEILTRKEGIISHSFISEEFLKLLEKYLGTISRENPYLLQSTRQGFMDEESLNWTLRELSKRASLKINKSLHWHLGRKLFLRTCAELSINQWNAKMMCGKSVEKDIETYLNGVALKEDFLRLNKVLKLKPERQQEGTSKELEELRTVMKILARYVNPKGISEDMSTDMEILKRFLEEER